MESIFSIINDNISTEGIVGSITEQLGNLTGAGGLLNSLIENPPAGLDDLVHVFNEFSIPDPDIANILGPGLAALRNIIPADSFNFTAGLSAEVDSLFAGMGSSLVDRISGAVTTFNTIADLLLGETARFRFVENTINSGIRLSRAAAGAEDEETTFPVFEAAIARIREFLELIPGSLTITAILKAAIKLCDMVPRRFIPLSRIPILDEFRDKTATLLAWQESNGAQICAQLANTLDTLADSMEQKLITGCIGNAAQRLETLFAALDRPALAGTLDAMTASLDNLAAKVRAGDLSGTEPGILALDLNATRLETLCAGIDTNLAETAIQDVMRNCSTLESRMNSCMLQLFALLIPSSGLAFLGDMISPVNAIIGAAGFDAINGKIGGFLDKIRELLDMISFGSIQDTLDDIDSTAAGAVENLNKILLSITIAVTSVMDRVRNAVNALDIGQVVSRMERMLNDLTDFIKQKVAQVFQPVGDLLNTTLSTINNFISRFNPRVIIDQVLELIRKLTAIVSNPQVLDFLDTVQKGLQTVNRSLEEFSFMPVTGTVLEAIEAVEKILEMAGRIPLTDAMKEDIGNALDSLPQSLDPVVQAITGRMNEFLEQGPGRLIAAIQDKPARLMQLLDQYSPANFVGDNFSAPYREFLAKMEEFRPNALFAPVQEKLDQFRERVKQTVDPAQLLDPLAAPFAEIIRLVDSFDPDSITAPIQGLISNAIAGIRNNLPLVETDALLAKIREITDPISKAINAGHALKDLLLELKQKLSGVAGVDNQFRDIVNAVTARFDELDDITPVADKLVKVKNVIGRIKADPLKQIMAGTINTVVTGLAELNLKNRLVDLIMSARGFPVAQLAALPASPGKSALTVFLEAFNPMQPGITGAVDRIDRWLSALRTTGAAVSGWFAGWDARFHGAGSPLTELAGAGISRDELKRMLAETAASQLSGVISPLLSLSGSLLSAIDNMITKLAALIDDLAEKVEKIMAIPAVFENLKLTIDRFFAALEGFDLTFLGTAIRSLFSDIKMQLAALDPLHIKEVLTTALNRLLDLLDLNALLGVDRIDRGYQDIVNTLRGLDPGKIVTELIQPEYDKIIGFIEKFNIIEPLKNFNDNLNKLAAELASELDKLAKAYAQMLEAAPF